MPGPNEPNVRSLTVVESSVRFETNKIRVTLNGTTVTIEYSTLPGNKPALYGNTVWLWAGSVIPFSGPPPDPVDAKPLSLDENVGSISLTGDIVRKEYIAGYSVNGTTAAVCTSATVQPPSFAELLLAPTWVTLSIYSVTTAELVIKYETLRGYKPRTYGNWLGLYKGDTLPWDAGTPYESVAPADDAQAGLARFIKPLDPGFTYTVIYYMADKKKKEANTSAAALLAFDMT